MVERETGILPISIGTSPAISAFDSQTLLRPVEQVASQSVTLVMINLTTLIRNYFASMTNLDWNNVPVQDIFDELIEEVKWIGQYINGLKKKCVFYFQDRKHIPYLFPNAQIKPEWTTPRQMMEFTITNSLLKKLYETLTDKEQPQRLSNDTTVVDGEYGTIMEVGKVPPRQIEVVGIVTHEPHHLLWYNRYQKLYLFESHTGAVKGSADFHTKLKTLKKDEVFPFNGVSLTVFGDGVHFKPCSISIRRELMDIGRSYKWSRITTAPAMSAGIKQLGSDVLKDAYAKLSKFIV